MFNIKSPNAIFSTLLLMINLGISGSANANFLPTLESWSLLQTNCPTGPEQYAELIQLKIEIAAAKTVEEAREMALAPTDVALSALTNATTLIPFSDDLQIAENRLIKGRSQIVLASSQAQVADEFSGMMLAGLDDDKAVTAKAGHGECNYSSGEVIAIVIGLILGIIPGLILLVVLC